MRYLLIAILVLGVAAGQTSDFHKQPYLLYTGGNTEMKVIWQMLDTYTCTIEWGTDTSYSLGNEQTTEYGDDHQHMNVIGSLSPGILYYYQISCGSESFQGSFHSGPEASETNLSFFVFGDTRTNYMTHDLIAEAMISIYTSEPEYHTILLATGDLVNYGASEVCVQDQFYNDSMTNARERGFNLPFMSVIGNHELYETGSSGDLTTPLFGKYFPLPYVERRYWSFDYGPAHFTMVDQYPPYYDPYGQGLIDSLQLVWIEDDLSSSSKPWKIVIFHEPGWSAGGSLHPESNYDVQELLQPLFEEHGVRVVFAGHNHYYLRSCKDGVYHITTGGGGAPLYNPGTGHPNIICSYKENHFCKLEICENVLTVTVPDLDGLLIDSFTVNLDTIPSHLLGSVEIAGGTGEVCDVLIEVDGLSANPDSFGYYGALLDPGIYDVTASLSGYTPQTFPATEITYGTETTLDITMNETSISGPSTVQSNLDQCIPNPFSQSTLIGYQLHDAGSVHLRIYDAAGRLVTTLAEGQYTAGVYSVVWNGMDDHGSEVPSGLYLCRLSAGEFSETRSMVLLR